MLYHILPKEDWLQAQKNGVYKPESLKNEGFIHCSDKNQVVGSANLHFKGVKNLLLMCIDPQKVQAEIRYEDLYNTSKLFPHIYGELELEAVEEVLDFPLNEDGIFTLPDSLNSPD
jgi:uncharacterized protein (DUF952 family)